jgi:methylenetetrahydrofolate dehydrogenase (NADP+) / methenyltetrahydrofolate cyclohydrolase
MKIDGRQIAKEILDSLRIKIAKQNVKPHLAIIIVGTDPASITYVKQKQIKAEEIGAETTLVNLKTETSQEDLAKLVDKFNKDSAINGIIVQKPLPSHIDNNMINLSINSKKDIDGFNPNTQFESPIGLSILEVLKKTYSNLTSLRDKNIVILGKGETGGKPIKNTLLKLGVKPIIVDSKTENPDEIIKNADIVISAVGKKEIIKASTLKKETVLIGTGQHMEEDKQLHGDYEEKEIENIVSFYTPTPGGIGPINVAMLLKNLCSASGL